MPRTPLPPTLYDRIKSIRGAKRNKYGNVRTEVDGISFASGREATRYGVLKLLERAGEIRGLTLQPRYKCVVNGRHVTTYVGDFAYFENNTSVVEDSKGFRTREYKLKKKLVEACYPGLTIRET